MSTIARLIVAVTGDNSSLRQTLIDSANRSQEFAERLNRQDAVLRRVAESNRFVSDTGRKVAESIIAQNGGMERFVQIQQQIQQEMIRSDALVGKQTIGLNAINSSSALAGSGLGRLRFGFASLISQATGLPPIITRISGVLGSIAIGSTAATLVLAGLAAIGVAYSKLTAESKKLAEETEKAIDRLLKLKNVQQGSTFGLDTDLQLADKRLKDLREKLDIEQKFLSGGTDNPSGDPGFGLTAEQIAAEKKKIQEINDDIAAGQRERVRIIQEGAEKTQAALTNELANLIKHNRASADDRSNALALLRAYQADFDRLSKTNLSGRSALLGLIDPLQNALFPKSGIREAASEQADGIKLLIDKFELAKEAGQGFGDELKNILDELARLKGSSSALNDIQGNIDLTHRPRVQTPQGIATVRSMSFEEGGLEILVPTVSGSGVLMTNEQAIAAYHRTGEFLGKFHSVDRANQFAEVLHQAQGAMVAGQGNGVPAFDFTNTTDALSRRAGETIKQYTARIEQIKALEKALQSLAPPKINLDINLSALNDQISKQVFEKWQKAFDQNEWENRLTHDFDEMVGRVQAFRETATLTNAARVANGEKPIDVERILEPMKQAALREALRIREILLSSGLDPRLYQPIIDQLIKGIDAIGNAGDKTAKKLANIGKEIQKISNVLSSLASLNDVLGGSERATRVLQDASSAANSVALAVAKGGKDPAADIQALADVIKTVKDVFSAAGEIRDENTKTIKENNERLHELAIQIAGFNTNASNTLGAGQAASALLANNAAREAFTRGATHAGGFLGTQTKGDLQTQIDALQPFLSSVGLTFDQFKKIVADAGFQIFDKFGRIIPEALQQFANHVQDVIKALFTFQNTLNDQQTLASLRSKLSGVDQTPTSDLKQQLGILQQLAPNLLPGQFDVSSAAGQEALRKALASLVERLATGGVDPSQFGAFQNLGELTQIIDALATALLGLKSTADSVTESLSNVPVGFKVALYRFDAARPELWGRNAPPAGGPIGDPLVNMPPTMGGNVTFIIQDGAVRVSGAPTDKPEEFGKKALAGMQALAQTKFGNSARWPDMN